MTASPRVAAIVVHYGDPAPTRRCIDSLTGIDEIVLVDQPPLLFGHDPRITTRLEPGRNVGFAAACNRAVESTNAPFVLLINNDAVLVPGAATALHRALPDIDGDVAGACLKLLCMDGRTIQSAGGLWFTRDGIGFPRAFGETDAGQYDGMPAHEIGVPSGAAALFRRDAWRDAGGMAEEFFCYCEDGDLGLRMVAAGARFAWLPGVVVHHELSSSSGAHSAFKAFHVERNHFATMIHTASLPALVALLFVTLARLLRTATDAARGRGAGAGIADQSSLLSLAWTLARAWVGAAAMMPSAVARRRSLLARYPDAVRRTGVFRAGRRVPLAEFARSRVAGATTPHDS